MRYSLTTFCAVLLLTCSVTLTTQAVPISGLYNTGLNGSGTYLATGQPDGNYSVIASPAGSFVPVATDDTIWPLVAGPWVPNNPTFSRWISPRANSGGPAGNYVYRTTFNLPANANLSTAMIGGVWGTDDPGTDIRINGFSTGQLSAGFTSLVPFSITSGFNFGLNTLDFYLTNAGGPTGLRVDRIQGKYDFIPEPGTFLLAALGLGGMLVRRRT